MLLELLTATVCHVSMWHGLPGPDNAASCTPGSYDRLTRAEACLPKMRPSLRARDRREILGEYRVPGWTGADGEIDHRVPFFLGGRTEPENLWPERGSIPNAKDKVEFRVYRRVCFGDGGKMRVRTARRIFLADWRVYYFAWKRKGEL